MKIFNKHQSKDENGKKSINDIGNIQPPFIHSVSVSEWQLCVRHRCKAVEKVTFSERVCQFQISDCNHVARAVVGLAQCPAPSVKRASHSGLWGSRGPWGGGGVPDGMEGETDVLSALSWAPGGYLFPKLVCCTSYSESCVNN